MAGPSCSEASGSVETCGPTKATFSFGFAAFIASAAAERPTREGPTRLGFLSNLSPEKGLDTAIEIFRLLRATSENVALMIGGPTPTPEARGIVDRAADGSECRWARILAFDPPDRVVFSWDISPRWTIETDQARTSEVEVRFYAETPDRTRVDLEHRHIDRHGPGWEAVTDAIDGPEGWPLYLDRYATLLTEAR